jgi:hypothetical protein
MIGQRNNPWRVEIQCKDGQWMVAKTHRSLERAEKNRDHLIRSGRSARIVQVNSDSKQ